MQNLSDYSYYSNSNMNTSSTNNNKKKIKFIFGDERELMEAKILKQPKTKPNRGPNQNRVKFNETLEYYDPCINDRGNYPLSEFSLKSKLNKQTYAKSIDLSELNPDFEVEKPKLPLIEFCFSQDVIVPPVTTNTKKVDSLKSRHETTSSKNFAIDKSSLKLDLPMKNNIVNSAVNENKTYISNYESKKNLYETNEPNYTINKSNVSNNYNSSVISNNDSKNQFITSINIINNNNNTNQLLGNYSRNRKNTSFENLARLEPKYLEIKEKPIHTINENKYDKNSDKIKNIEHYSTISLAGTLNNTDKNNYKNININNNIYNSTNSISSILSRNRLNSLENIAQVESNKRIEKPSQPKKEYEFEPYNYESSVDSFKNMELYSTISFNESFNDSITNDNTNSNNNNNNSYASGNDYNDISTKRTINNASPMFSRNTSSNNNNSHSSSNNNSYNNININRVTYNASPMSSRNTRFNSLENIYQIKPNERSEKPSQPGKENEQFNYESSLDSFKNFKLGSNLSSSERLNLSSSERLNILSSSERLDILSSYERLDFNRDLNINDKSEEKPKKETFVNKEIKSNDDVNNVTRPHFIRTIHNQQNLILGDKRIKKSNDIAPNNSSSLNIVNKLNQDEIEIKIHLNEDEMNKKNTNDYEKSSYKNISNSLNDIANCNVNFRPLTYERRYSKLEPAKNDTELQAIFQRIYNRNILNANNSIDQSNSSLVTTSRMSNSAQRDKTLVSKI